MLKAANVPSFEWVNSGASSDAGFFDPAPESRGMAVDSAGNTYVAGNFGTPHLTFGATTIANSGAAETIDGFVAKHDKDGALQWVKVVGGAGSQDIADIARDAAGNLYLIGSFTGATTVGGTTLSASGQDVMVVKLDANGDPVWFKKFGGSGSDSANSITVDAAGNVFIAGQFNNNITLGLDTFVPTGDFDIFVAKLDTQGDVVWAKKAGGTLLDSPGGIALDPAGNVILQGNYTGSITLGGATLDSGTQTSLFVAKYDPMGSLVWGAGATSANFSFFTDVKVTADGKIYVCGRFRTSITAGATTLVSASGSSEDAFVGRLDGDGNWVWAVRGGSAQGIDYANHLVLRSDGSALVAGYYTASAARPAIFGTTELAPFGQLDGFVAAINSDGEWEGALRAGSMAADNAVAIGIDNSDGIYVTGSYSSSATFPALSLSFVGLRPNIFVGKLSFPEELVIQTHPRSITTVVGQNVVLAVDVSGAEPVTHQWYKNDMLLPGETEGTLSFTPVAASDAGAYKVEVGNTMTTAFFSNPAELVVYPANQNVTVNAALTFGTSQFESAISLAVDANGNRYFSGAVGGAGTIDSTSVGGFGGQDAVLVKVNSSGEVEWVWSGGGTGSDSASGVLTDSSGNVYVVVEFTGSIDIGLTHLEAASGSASSLAFVKFNSAGEIQSVVGAVGNGLVRVADSVIDASGNRYFTGEVGFVAGASAQFGDTLITSPDGMRDVWVARLNAVGVFDWATQFTADAGQSVAPKLALRPGGGVWVGGVFLNTVDFGAMQKTAANNLDLFIATVDDAGVVVAVETRDAGSVESLVGLGSAGGNDVFVVSTFNGALSLGSATLSNADANADLAVWKQTMDGSQAVSWSQQFQSIGGSVFARSARVTLSGRLLISGTFNNLLANPAGSVFTGEQFGTDSFVLGINADGTVAGLAQTGQKINGIFNASAELPSGALVTFGAFSADVNFGGHQLTTSGFADFVLVELAAFTAPAPSLFVSNPVRQPTGIFTFTITGPAGQDVTVRTAATLNEAFGNPTIVPNPDGDVLFQDGSAVGQERRFYQIFIPAP